MTPEQFYDWTLFGIWMIWWMLVFIAFHVADIQIQLRKRGSGE